MPPLFLAGPPISPTRQAPRAIPAPLILADPGIPIGRPTPPVLMPGAVPLAAGAPPGSAMPAEEGLLLAAVTGLLAPPVPGNGVTPVRAPPLGGGATPMAFRVGPGTTLGRGIE
jgi:hypothetical protein